MHPVDCWGAERHFVFAEDVGKVIDIARVLQVGMDQLFGEVVPDEGHVSNLRLLRRFRDLENLSKEDQDVAVKLIDPLIAKSKIKKLVS